MNPKVAPLFQGIGNAILDLTGDSASKALGYAEAEDGVVSVSLFYLTQDGGCPIFKYGNKELSRLFYELWNVWREEGGQPSWRAAEYFIGGGKPNLQVVYQEKFDENEDEFDRRDKVVSRYFGSADIDYSNPE